MKDDLVDIFSSCLESMERGEHSLDELLALYHEHRSELESLLGAVTAIKQRADFAPRPSFRLSSRARLFRILETAQKPEGSVRASKPFRIPKFSRKLAMSWAILLVLIVSMVSGGTAYAFNKALPGDTLHPVKLFIEDARLFISDDAEKAALAVEYVDVRVQEIQALVAANGNDDDLDLAVSLLDEKVAAANTALAALAKNDPERAAQLAIQFEQSLLRHTEALTLHLDSVSDEAKPAIERAIKASSAGRQTVQNLFETGFPGGPLEGIPPPFVTQPAEVPSDSIPAPFMTPPAGAPSGGTPGPVTTLPGGGPPENVPAPIKTPSGSGGPPDHVPGPPSSVPGNRP